MSSEAITRNDLSAILNEVLPPTPSEYKKLLWTNPSPASSFSAQTISLNLSDYDCVEIETYLSPNGMTTTRLTEVGKIGEVGGLGSAGDRYTRMATVSATGITFTEGKTNGTTNNANALPYKIYGIKYERVAPPQVDASDYVVEYGTSGIWTYRKWDSGIAECWGTHSATASVSTAWGYTFYGSVSMPNFPSIFIATPSRQATLSTPGGMAWLVPNSSNLSSTSPGGMYIFSGANVGSVSCTISVYAIGKWK